MLSLPGNQIGKLMLAKAPEHAPRTWDHKTMRRSRWFSSVLLCLPLLAKVPLQPVQVTTTDHVELGAGGTIRLSGSMGQLDVEGWDRPEVEITVVKSTWRSNTPKERDEATRELSLVKVAVATRVSVDSGGPEELVISTRYPSRTLTRPLRGKTDVNLEYHIKVPRDAHLVIRHDSGDVRLYDLSGEIDATSRAGDMVLLLPASGRYSIDARCGVGGVYSDFEGKHRTPYAVGERFNEETEGSVVRVHLRVGMGGIQILKMAPSVRQP